MPPYHIRLRQRRIGYRLERKDDPLGNRECAGQGCHPADPDPITVRSLSLGDHFNDGRRRRVVLLEDITERSNAEADSPIGALRRAHGVTQPAQFSRERDRTSVSGSHHARQLSALCLSISISSSRSAPWVHPCGERLLCAVAKVARNAAPEDFVARCAAMNLWVLSRNITIGEDAAVSTAQLSKHLASVTIDNHWSSIGASVGIA